MYLYVGVGGGEERRREEGVGGQGGREEEERKNMIPIMASIKRLYHEPHHRHLTYA